MLQSFHTLKELKDLAELVESHNKLLNKSGSRGFSKYNLRNTRTIWVIVETKRMCSVVPLEARLMLRLERR